MTSNPIVLVTGINGFVGSHVADQFLEAGYNVRGTARTIEKGDIVKNILTKKHGAGRIEIIAVPDISSDGVFDKAVEGCYAVAHVASILATSPSKYASEVVPQTIAAAISILASCSKEPSIKSFVFTSSSIATCFPLANVRRHIDANSWNEDDVRDAWKPESEWEEGHEWHVYGASKTEAEKAVWKFKEEKKPDFTVNSVLPSTCFGRVLSRDVMSSTGKFIDIIYQGNVLALQLVTPQYCVDVKDVAKLHVAAVKFQDVKDRRIFAWAAPYNWNQVLKVLRELRPDHTFPDDIPDPGECLNVFDDKKDEELLEKIKGKGWTPFREMLEETLQSYGY